MKFFCNMLIKSALFLHQEMSVHIPMECNKTKQGSVINVFITARPSSGSKTTKIYIYADRIGIRIDNIHTQVGFKLH